MSIEVFNGPFAASLWADAHNDPLVETAVTFGATDWELKRTAWGVVFEVAFKTETYWELYKDSEAVRNALQTAPEPETGVLIYRGRSLDTGNHKPRKPKPKSGSGANALALPIEFRLFEPLPAYFSDAVFDRRPLTGAH